MMKGYLAWEYTGDVPTEDLAPDAPLPDPALRRSPLASRKASEDQIICLTAKSASCGGTVCKA